MDTKQLRIGQDVVMGNILNGIARGRVLSDKVKMLEDINGNVTPHVMVKLTHAFESTILNETVPAGTVDAIPAYELRLLS